MTIDLKGVNLYLIGMMGCGKTTVGRILAQQLGYRFFDTDAVIEQAAGQTVSEIFATAGEAAFRQLETQVLAELSAYKRLAIATGGGIVLHPMNWSYLRHGVVVWLDASIDQLYDRLAGDTSRPLLQDPDPKGRLRSLLDQRRSFYAQADVHTRVPVGASPKQVAIAVLDGIQPILRSETELPQADWSGININTVDE